MKKSLIMILGAALLMVGCSKELETKVDDLASRVDEIEAQVKANKAAIEELKNANFIVAVEETSTGWVITLSNGKKLNLYNGKDGQPGADGKDGDSFFQNVEIVGGNVVITLTDGTQFTIPYQAAFEVVLATADLVPNPGEQMRVKYEIVGKTDKTTVNVIASGNYFANIEGDEVVVDCPAEVTPGRLLVYADNGAGKTSFKTIDIDKQRISVDKADVSIPFWSGSASFVVASNVEETVEVDPADKGWLSVVRTKGVVNKEYTVTGQGTPYKDMRYGTVYVKDPAGKVIQTVKVAQGGTGHPIFIEKVSQQFDTFADAIAFGETMEDKDVRLSISQSLLDPYTTQDICVIPQGTTKNWVITKRSIGNADGTKCIIGGIRVEGDSWVNAYDVAIHPTGLAKHVGGQQFTGYPYGVLVTHTTTENCHVTLSNLDVVACDQFKTAQGTLLAVDYSSKAEVLAQNWHGVTNGCRYAQIYGGNVTLKGCEISDSYSYAVRIGQDGTKCTLTGNLVDNPTFVDLHSTLKNATVTFGDGVTDDNHYSSKVTLVAKGSPAETVTVAPKSVVGAAPVAGDSKVTLNGFGFAKIQDAVDFAHAGDVVEVGAGEYDEVVRVATWKNLTIKGADAASTIINGGLEIAGAAVVKDLTIKSKNGLTTNEVTVAATGDQYNWGHLYLVRIENGAHDVTLDGVTIDATDNTVQKKDGTPVNQSMTALFIAQCSNINILNSTILASEDGAYCSGQVYGAQVLYKNCLFTGGGAEKWATRIATTADVVVDGCEFNSPVAIGVYKDFAGKLTLGDGSTDNNVYGSTVEKAVSGDKDAAVAAGAIFLPEDMLFNAPTTVEGACFDVQWTVDMVEAGIADSRNFTFDGTNVICGCCPKDFWWKPAEMVAVRGGQVVATLAWDAAWVNGFTGAVTGLTTTKDNGETCILACNVASEGNQWAATNNEFNVYKYTGLDKVEKVLSYTRTSEDNRRMGDYFSFSGTWQDGAILVCEANNNAPRVYEFAVKDGVVNQTPTTIPLNEEARSLKSGSAGVFHYKDDIYVITNEGGAGPLVVKREGGNMKLVAQLDLSAINKVHKDKDGNPVGGKDLRTPKFVTLNGKEYMVGIVGSYNGKDMIDTATLFIMPIINGDIVASVAAATRENCFIKDIEGCLAGNGFAGLDVIQKGQTLYIGYGVRAGELGLIKFRNE